MDTTEWERYGTGNYEKCADCMVHCGYEGTAVNDTIARPWKALRIKLFGHRVDGAMAPEISLENQRPAEFIFESLVKKLSLEIEKPKPDRAKTDRPKRSDEGKQRPRVTTDAA